MLISHLRSARTLRQREADGPSLRITYPCFSTALRASNGSEWSADTFFPPRLNPAPIFQGEHPQSHHDQLAGDKSHQSTERPIHKTIGMQADAKHINSEPGQTEHDVAKNTHHRKSTFANQATPAGVKNDRVPHYDKPAFVEGRT